MVAGRIVEPDEPTCVIPNMPVFKVGFWNGLYHSPAMLRELAENFRRFSFWQPYGSINHKDVLACGRVKDVRFDGQTLFLDLGSLPESVGKAWNAGFLHGPSIEYWDTLENAKHKLTSGFRRDDGKPPGLVLRCVTLCGNGAPAVKTLGPMPKAIYEAQATSVAVAPATQRFDNWRAFGDFGRDLSNTDPATRRFSSEDFMDKAAMIASLKAAQPWLTDEFLNSLPDQQLSMLLDAAQGASASGAVSDATAGAGGPGIGGAPAGGAAPAAGADVASAGGGGGSPDFEKMMSDCGGDMKKMMDVATLAARETVKKYKNVSTLEAQYKGIINDAEKKTNSIIGDKIKTFMDGPAATRIPPAQRPFFERALRKCDPLIVRKFSDGKTVGSELDEMMAEIQRQFPVQAGFVRQFSDAGDAPNANAGGRELNDVRIQNTLRLCSLMPELASVGERLKKQHAA